MKLKVSYTEALIFFYNVLLIIIRAAGCELCNKSQMSNKSDVDGLFDKEAYQKHCDNSAH